MNYQHLLKSFRKTLSVFGVVILSSCASMTPNVATVNYGSVLIGNSATGNVTWSNTSKNTVNFLGFIKPSAPFSQTAPVRVIGANLAPAATTPPATFVFTPTAVGTFNDTATPLLGNGDSATPATLTGIGVSHLISGKGFGIAGGNFRSNQVLDFGKIRVGQTSTRNFRLLNGSNAPLSMTGRVLGAGPFSVTAPAQPIVLALAANPLIPTRVRVTLTFAPRAPGRFMDLIQFTDPANPGHQLTLVVTGTAE